MARVGAQARALGPGIAAVCVVLSCAEDPLTRLLPRIEVDPPELDFGAGVVAQDNLQILTIRNLGGGDLDIEGVRVEPVSISVFRNLDAPRGVPSHSEEQVRVAFAPERAGEIYRATLIVRSSDPARPEAFVPLTGRGGVREIEVSPGAIDFGTVNEGTILGRSVEIKNVGQDRLEISSVTLTSTAADLGLVAGTFSGGALAAGASATVDLIYGPVDLGADEGVLEVRSNDADEPRVEVSIRGRANLAPRAIAWGCDEVPEAPRRSGCDGRAQKRTLTAGFRRIIGLDGRASMDPEGDELRDFAWRVVARPTGSNAAVFHSTEDVELRRRATGEIETDRAGRYDLLLVVKDGRGLESFDRPESHVMIVPRDLEVLLRWDVTTDVDLHLVRPGGRVGDYGSGLAGTSTGSDCSSFNREPNWSDLALADDDPRLDKDDVTGVGPEVVSLDSPEDGGTYGVFAHFCDSRGTGATANVVLDVYVRGDLAATVPTSGDGYALRPGELWEAAQIVWDASGPRAIVNGSSDRPPSAAPGLCIVD